MLRHPRRLFRMLKFVDLTMTKFTLSFVGKCRTHPMLRHRQSSLLKQMEQLKIRNKKTKSIKT